ncbi:MAG: type II toxin-antitoxin system prevent-host-death family antitoxin [Spirochaetia bacterium]|nr:type II toxin-antitoxin system prevent-host-death family antitoxin [Spirochaetia bacterium]
MSDSIPIFEAKNRLPYFIHKAETEGPVFLSRRGKNVAVIISMAEYEEKFLKKRSFIDEVNDLKEEYLDVLDNEDIFANLRDKNDFGRPSMYHHFEDEEK